MNPDISKMQHVAQTRTDIFIEADNSREVNARIRAMNRQRKKIVEKHEESVMGTPASAFPHPLQLVKVCPSYNPPGMHITYAHHYHQQAYDSEGNAIGSQEEWDQAEYDRLAALMPQAAAPSADAEQALMKRLGLTEDDMAADPAGDAIREAERQKGRELTESERQHIRQAMNPDNIPDDLDDI